MNHLTIKNKTRNKTTEKKNTITQHFAIDFFYLMLVSFAENIDIAIHGMSVTGYGIVACVLIPKIFVDDMSLCVGILMFLKFLYIFFEF